MAKIVRKIRMRNGFIAICECCICKSETERRFSRIKNTKHITCSPACRKEYEKTIGVKKVWDPANGVGPKPQKGCGITSDGYVWIWMSGRPFNQIKLHRYLMEVKIGRKLLSSEIVHHIDGNKLNNQVENLEITSISEHNKKHGHFRKENRDDCYSDDELQDIFAMSCDDFIKKYPKRTKGAVYTKRNRLRK